MSALTVASTMQASNGSSYIGTDRERVFRAAARHSWWVRFHRRAIPVGLVLVLGAVGAIAYFKPLHMLAALDPSRLTVSGTKVTMEAPKLGGFTRDGRPYDLTAKSAQQDITDPSVLMLNDVHAHVEMQDKSLVDLKAASGVYDTKADQLKLYKDIVLTSSIGYSARLDEAAIDIKKNRIVSDKPVEVTMTNGTVNANHLEVTENGELIRFDNGVEMNVVPPSAPGAAHATDAAVKPNAAAANPRR